MIECILPACTHPPTGTNRSDQPTCDDHRLVVVSGSFVHDRHADD